MKMRAHVRGTEIYFDIDGAALAPLGSRLVERPTLFLIHGGPGSDHVSDKVRYGRLRDKLQLVFHDLRGHGRSGRCDPARYNLDENVEDLDALRNHLGLDRIAVLGTSYGGRVAMAYAARHAVCVSHLILVATSAHSGSLQRATEIVRLRGTPEQVSACEDLYAGRIDSAEKFHAYLSVTAPLYSFREPTERRTRPTSIFEPEPLGRAFGPGGFMWTLDLRPELGAIKAPTLILAGRHDWRCAPEFSEELQAMIPHADLRIFENSAHDLAYDEPDELFDAVAGFMTYQAQ
jgi:proline iminopeptidase